MIVLRENEPGINANSAEIAKAITSRIGLEPRKKGSTEDMHKPLLELYERSKKANREKKPEEAIITVEEMALHAGITRQTMYDYLKRWLDLNLIVKTSYIKDSKVVIGYRLNGPTLESAFEKSQQRIRNNLETTMKLIKELQKTIKNEKISKSVSNKEMTNIPEDEAENLTEETSETDESAEEKE
ncbi:MAG: hypothetical protein Q8O89_03205 [Nanoarchaeota archaeon]|nr:hypothetical protein [Nanoarchaeota archaeon]